MTAKMIVEYRDHMGSDESIIDDARVSFGKRFTQWDAKAEGLIHYLATGMRSKERNALADRVIAAGSREEALALIDEARNIATHWAPAAQQVAKVFIKAPLAVARQLWRSHIGMATQDEIIAWSEESRRYITDRPEFYIPEVFRSAADDVKQGSGAPMSNAMQAASRVSMVHASSAAVSAYMAALQDGMAPEQARFYLPGNIMVSWVWTGSLAAMARVYTQRMDAHAQAETREVARMIGDIAAPLFPRAWPAFTRTGGVVHG